MSELYLYCKAQGMGGCERFKNPERAMGGVFWNVAERYVRTDTVCHAMNAYINMIDHLGDGALVKVPERPLSERLALGAAAPGMSATKESLDSLDHDDQRDDEEGDGDSEESDMAGGEESGEEAAQ